MIPQAGVLVVLPHVPQDAGLRRRRGRPRTVGLQPTVDQEVYEDQIAGMRDAFVEEDPLVAHLDPQNGDRLTTLDLLIQGVAEEQAAVAYEARRAERQGRADAAVVISRRIDALIKLAGLVLAREQLRQECGSITPEAVDAVLGSFLDEVGVVARETIPEGAAEVFLAEVAAKVTALNPAR